MAQKNIDINSIPIQEPERTKYFLKMLDYDPQDEDCIKKTGNFLLKHRPGIYSSLFKTNDYDRERLA